MLRTILMLGLVPMALATSTAYAQTAAPPPGTPTAANAVDPASIQAHGTHFIPSAVSQNGSLISFLTTAIAGNVSNAPIGSTQ